MFWLAFELGFLRILVEYKFYRVVIILEYQAGIYSHIRLSLICLNCFYRASKWNSSTSPIEVKTVVFEGCMSMGDAMREVDARSLITNDFVLVNADVVANINLAPIIDQHK